MLSTKQCELLQMQFTRRALLLMGTGLLLIGCTHTTVGNALYSVGVSREGNHVTIAMEEDVPATGYLVTIQSERGIGQASFAWWGSEPPHPMRFLVELQGLESFQLTWHQQTVSVSVNAIDQSIVQSLRTSNGAEQAITPDSPYWMQVEMPTAGRSGYLLSAPEAFVAQSPRLWAVQWIDFYR